LFHHDKNGLGDISKEMTLAWLLKSIVFIADLSHRRPVMNSIYESNFSAEDETKTQFYVNGTGKKRGVDVRGWDMGRIMRSEDHLLGERIDSEKRNG
jgi:hypothetical protein